MKRFQFKLQAVLTLRLRAEQQALELYARAIETRQAASDQVTEAESALCETRRRWLNELADGCPAARAAQMLGYCHHLEERKQQAEQALALAESEMTKASESVLHARQQREVVEKHFSRERDHYDRELQVEERKLIDEMVQRPGANALSGIVAGSNVWN